MCPPCLGHTLLIPVCGWKRMDGCHSPAELELGAGGQDPSPGELRRLRREPDPLGRCQRHPGQGRRVAPGERAPAYGLPPPRTPPWAVRGMQGLSLCGGGCWGPSFDRFCGLLGETSWPGGRVDDTSGHWWSLVQPHRPRFPPSQLPAWMPALSIPSWASGRGSPRALSSLPRPLLPCHGSQSAGI